MRMSVLAGLALATTALAVPAAEAGSRSHGRSRDDRSYSRPSNRYGSGYGYGNGHGHGNRYSHSYRPYRSYGRSYHSYRPYYYSVPYGYYGGYDDGYYQGPPDYYYRRYCPPRPQVGFYFGF
jgi:hypothetical protein